ncbi:MAG: fibronectin type III domain-containing protein [Sumerlaeia bacterium]
MANQDQIAKKAASEQATEVKNDRKKVLRTNISRLKSWAEGIVGKNDPRLTELGFSAPAAGAPLQKPGQPDELNACGVKPIGEFELEWKKPTTGGKVAGYQILRKLPTEGTFTIHTTASSKVVEKVLTGQPVNVLIQYRILSFNDAGDSLPSNTVEVKL